MVSRVLEYMETRGEVWKFGSAHFSTTQQKPDNFIERVLCKVDHLCRPGNSINMMIFNGFGGKVGLGGRLVRLRPYRRLVTFL